MNAKRIKSDTRVSNVSLTHFWFCQKLHIARTGRNVNEKENINAARLSFTAVDNFYAIVSVTLNLAK